MKILPLNFKNIYINNLQNNVIDCGYNINFKINIIFIINEDDKYIQKNLLFFLKEKYTNFNIIIFFNNIKNDKFNIDYKKYNNIFIFKSNKKLLNIDIIIYLTKISEKNSLMILINNNYLVNNNYSLNYINLLFFLRRLLVTDYFGSQNTNIIVYKRELLTIIPQYTIYKLFGINNNDKYLIYLLFLFKKISHDKNYLLNYDFDIDFDIGFDIGFDIDFNIDIENFYDNDMYNCNDNNGKDLLNNYLSLNIKNYSNEKITLFYENINFIYRENIIEKNKITKYDAKYINLFIYLYKINYIDYFTINDNINIIINNNKALIQIVIFIHENYNLDNFETEINKIKNETKNTDIQINIIEFNVNQNISKYVEKYNINYIFFDTTNFKKYKFNKALSYNMMINIFNQYTFIFKYIFFHNIDYTINYNIEHILLLLKDNDIICIHNNIIINNELINNELINNELINNVGMFDPEIFFEYYGHEIDFFLKKIKKLNNVKIYNLIIDNVSKIDSVSKIDNYYNSILNNFEYIDDINMFYNFLRNRIFINNDLWKNIKTYIINLDDRHDRLKDRII